MSDEDEVGYGKPPRRTRFRKGVCPNPQGRGRRKDGPLLKALEAFDTAPVEYTERGKRKRASRIEVTVQRHITAALAGDVAAAMHLLDLRRTALKGVRDGSPLRIRVEGGLPEGEAEHVGPQKGVDGWIRQP